jgi:hypothetical protein
MTFARPSSQWVLSSVTLVVRGAELDPADVTRQLSVEPTASRPAGFDRWARPGDTDGQWRLEIDDRATREFDEQLESVLSLAEQKRTELRALRDAGHSVQIAVRGYADNDSQLFLPAETIGRLTHVGVTLVLNPSLSER